MSTDKDINSCAQVMATWYDARIHTMPWRQQQDDPYAVWIGETMLQQTTVHTIQSRYPTFMAQFPTVHALATATESTVMEAWAGLGYYARARNMHAAAKIMHIEGYPQTVAGWRQLPGVGAYIARSVSAIAQHQPVIGVDVHVQRILQRMHTPHPPWNPKALQSVADAYAIHAPRAVQQAFFDIGRLYCRPKAPECGTCPIAAHCNSAGRIADTTPTPRHRHTKPIRRGRAYAWIHHDHVYMIRRPPTGLLGGTLALPSQGWAATDNDIDQDIPWIPAGVITHTFAHFILEMEVFYTPTPESVPTHPQGTWYPMDTATSTMNKKCLDILRRSIDHTA